MMWPFHRDGPKEQELYKLRHLLERVKSAPACVRLAIGAGVRLANTEFIRRFGDMESFRRMSEEGRRFFSRDLSKLELDLRNQEPGAALGVGLYRIWLEDSLAHRSKRAEMLGEELTELSRKGSAPSGAQQPEPLLRHGYSAQDPTTAAQ